jgi:hypothetical protein
MLRREESMLRNAFLISTAVTLSVALSPTSVKAQTSDAARISSAMAAAQASIAKDATIMDWAEAGGKMRTLRTGKNGWTCMPSRPKSRYVTNNAMCMDANFADFMTAMRSRKQPALKAMGTAYMLTSDQWISNTTPSDRGPKAGNEWHHVSAAMMLAYPHRSSLAGLPVRPSSNGPYVMWPGTPYAHVMVPLK